MSRALRRHAEGPGKEGVWPARAHVWAMFKGLAMIGYEVMDGDLAAVVNAQYGVRRMCVELSLEACVVCYQVSPQYVQ